MHGVRHPGQAGSVRSQGRPPRSPCLCLENTDWGQLVTPLHHHSRATGTVFSCAWVRPRRMGDCSENTLSHGRDLEFMQPSRQPVRLLRYLPIQNVKDALRPKGPAVRSPAREAGGIGVISMSAEGAAQWECRALRPSDYGSRSSPPSRAGLFTAGPSALARPVPSGSWCKQNNIFMCLGVRRTCKTAVRFGVQALACPGVVQP